MELLCYLLTTIITACHPAAEQYTEAAASVPPAHWQPVQRVTIWEFPFGAADPQAGGIVLPVVVDSAALRHEVGHLVAHANNEELGRLFELIFRHQERPRWTTVSGHEAFLLDEPFRAAYSGGHCGLTPCSRGGRVMATGRSDAEREIRAVNDAFVRHFNVGDAEELVRAVYAEDARLLPANAPTIRGRAQIIEAYREILASGMGGLVVDSCEVEVAGSGELAYAIGTFSVATPEPDRGKFVEVYRKQADGSWRCVADMFSSDRAAT